jgi:hypothetical protein
MGTYSTPQKEVKSGVTLLNKMIVQQVGNFSSMSVPFKGGNYSTLTRHVRRAHAAVCLRVEHLTPAHSLAGNESGDTNPNIQSTISSSEYFHKRLCNKKIQGIDLSVVG